MSIDFPANPTNGQVYGNWIYDSSITSWRNVNTDTGIGTLNAMGLKNVVPTSVDVGSGSATVNANGTVIFNSVSSISLNNVFPSQYSKYVIKFNTRHTTSGGTSALFKFRYNGSDFSSGYYGASWYALYGGSSATADLVNNGSNAYFGAMNTTVPVDVTSQVALTNTYSSINSTYAIAYAGGIQVASYSTPTSSNIPNGFTIYTTTGGLTGTLNVYGYTQ
jgi:hypothetical protein